ncbi:MAG: hypothetical protein ACYC8T_26230 [Myxococcaceae bacterium]
MARDPKAPDFSRGAVIFSIQGGTGLWGIDRAHLSSQVTPPEDVDVFIGEAQNGPTVSLKLGYNILGHVTLDAELTGTGWNVFDSNRGGAGFLVGALHWHPLELVWLKKARPVPFDFSAFFGYGYGIAGSSRGMDGNLMEFGVDADYYVAKAVGLGIFARGVFLNWDKYYYDYDGKVFVNLPRGSGGSFWTFGLSLDFRFET